MFLLADSFGKVFTDALLDKVLRSELFIIFVVLMLGYLVGRISIKGVTLGSSGVFIVALCAGIFLYKMGDKLGIKWYFAEKIGLVDGELVTTRTLTGGSVSAIIKNFGLVLFVASIGFIAGPTFIRNFKKKATSYLAIGASAVLVGTVICIIIIKADKALDPATGVGLLMGALSSTPGQASAQIVFGATAELRQTVAAAVGLAYPFGVLGVVLFVQLMPKILRKDMKVEVEKLRATSSGAKFVAETEAMESPDMAKIKKPVKPLFKMDSMGICVFAAAAVLGIFLGNLTAKLGSINFSLTTTGGALIVGLLFGHFNHVGRISLEVPTTTLKTFRELGLILFLTGSGIEGGLKFLDTFKVIYLFYGMIMTLTPMIVAFVVGRYAFKLELLNNLGAVCGGMTSTPALGSLIYVSGTEDVAQSYAATYPFALFLLVFVPQIINLIC